MALHPIISFLTQETCFADHLSLQVALDRKTSFKCNAQAAAVFSPTHVDEVGLFLQKTAQAGFYYLQDFHVLGKGSNLLFRDGGYPGCLIDLTRLNKIETIAKDQVWKLDAQAGVGMGRLLQLLRKDAYTGFEFVFGIPGSIGGGIRMNAGTPDGWFSQVLTQVQGFDAYGTYFTQAVGEDDFLYRDFPFGTDKIITGGSFVFAKSTSEIVEKKIALAKVKRDRQPLSYPNFGSVFKNPKPAFAGALIEEVGLKGYRLGDAQISEQHANFMINHGKARFVDVEALIQTAQEKISQEKNIYLETEVHILGEA
ncbi:MAG: UDP-N-acetylmuramate dehydrogenase [Deltaproteobacteria bacterium]|nr:UDP-N-acetylmuramate dehydrogenase [Deltaproteobacteria bacterium]